ncbi:hypothetical protein [uncultured Methanoregula sp.]|uniref:hypothetical protein n=1 Tax=uncultured Methanoregula sp. TaxID=1005933 RepID=UPI002AAB6D29|nr:hypothetical protein [uncultured Methanoregula sp.]
MSDISIKLIVTSLLILIFLVDAITPLGIPVWLLYFIPLAISYWIRWRYAIPVVFVITITFLIFSFFISPPGVPVDVEIGYRSVFFFIFLLLSVLLWFFHLLQYNVVEHPF